MNEATRAKRSSVTERWFEGRLAKLDAKIESLMQERDTLKATLEELRAHKGMKL